MINNPKDREKLYDDIREGCKVSFDGGICLSVDIKKDSYRELTKLVTEYIIKALKSYYDSEFEQDNFLVKYRDDILNLPNRTPNGAFYPKVENIKEYNKVQSLINDILVENNLVNQFSSFDLSTIRIVDGRESKMDSRLSATTRLHSDAWAGHEGDAILTIGVLGDKTTSLEFNRIIGKVSQSFFETQHDYASASKLFEGHEYIGNLEFGNMTIFDHACLHRTIKSEGGLRVSIDIGVSLKASSGLLKNEKKGRNIKKIKIDDMLKVGKETLVEATETLEECYNRFKDDKYDKVPVSYIHDTINIG